MTSTEARVGDHAQHICPGEAADICNAKGMHACRRTTSFAVVIDSDR